MARTPKQALIGFATIHGGRDPREGEPIPLVGLPAALGESVQAGTTITRYGRTWHMGRPHQEDGYLMGTIGFDTTASPEWDPAVKDFRSVLPAQVSQFAVDLERMRVGFQLRGRAIKPWSFQGAFQALLNAATTPYSWSVLLEGVPLPPWEEWRTTVTRITEVTARLKRPNPFYPDKEVERLFDEVKAAAAVIGASGDDIDPDGGILGGAIAHVLNGYGSLSAKAVRVEDGRAESDAWSTEAQAAIRRERVPVDPETGAFDPEQLKQALDASEEQEDE